MCILFARIAVVLRDAVGVVPHFNGTPEKVLMGSIVVPVVVTDGAPATVVGVSLNVSVPARRKPRLSQGLENEREHDGVSVFHAARVRHHPA